jgi:small basic protein
VIAALGLLIGIVLGLIFQPDVPLGLEPYLPIAVVAALDAVFGGLRAYPTGSSTTRCSSSPSSATS